MTLPNNSVELIFLRSPDSFVGRKHTAVFLRYLERSCGRMGLAGKIEIDDYFHQEALIVRPVSDAFFVRIT